METGEQVLEADFALLHVAGAFVAVAVPPAADVALDNHLVAAVAEAVADVAAHLGVGVVDVHVVDAAVEGGGDQLAGGCGVNLIEAAAADADHAHTQAGAAEGAVLHVGVLLECGSVFLAVAGSQQQCRAHHGEACQQDVGKFSHIVIFE